MTTLRSRRAFTLVELLVVLLVLGVLVAIALPLFGHAQDSAKNADIKTKLNTAYKGLKAYAPQHDSNLPEDGAGVVSAVQDSEPNFPISNTKTPTAGALGVCSASTDGVVLVGLSRSGDSFTVTASKSGSYTLAQASCPLNVPGATGTPTAEAGDGEATVSWTAPSSGPEPTSYTVTSSPGGLICSTTEHFCVVGGLANGTAYTFTVVASNDDGDGVASAASDPVTPQASGYPTAAGIYFRRTVYATNTTTLNRVQSDGTGLANDLGAQPPWGALYPGSSAKRVLFYLGFGQFQVSRPDGTEAFTISKPDACAWAPYEFEVSSDGEEAYFFCSDGSYARHGFTVNANTGVATETGVAVVDPNNSPLSPDGTKRLWANNNGLYVTDRAGNNATLLVATPTDPNKPGWNPNTWSSAASWSRDGTKVIFLSDFQAPDLALVCSYMCQDMQEMGNPNWEMYKEWVGSKEFYVVNTDGTGLTRLPGDMSWQVPPVFSPDKSKVAYVTNSGISVRKTDGTGSPTEIASRDSGEVLSLFDWR